MYDVEIILWTTMIAGYAQNGYIEMVDQFFNEIPHQNVIWWNVMMASYGSIKKEQDIFW